MRTLMLVVPVLVMVACNGGDEESSCDTFEVDVTVLDVDGVTPRDDATVSIVTALGVPGDPCESQGSGHYSCTGAMESDVNQVSATVPQGQDASMVTPPSDCGSSVPIQLVIMQMVGA
jgi:hypothetical protein